MGIVEHNQVVYQLKIQDDCLVYETMNQIVSTPDSLVSDNLWSVDEQNDEMSTLVMLDPDTSIKYCCVLTGK